jgi:hypothetical protein
MSRALLVGYENGTFVFSKDTQQGHIQDDDVLFNWTTQDTMTLLRNGLPF